jgi:hypothetical protein
MAADLRVAKFSAHQAKKKNSRDLTIVGFVGMAEIARQGERNEAVFRANYSAFHHFGLLLCRG